MAALAQVPAFQLQEYAARANRTDRFAQDPQGYDKLRFGFFGEVGGLLAAVKKVSRDQLRESETEVAGEELGDALWYLFACAATRNVQIEVLGAAALAALRRRFGEAERLEQTPPSFRQLDGLLAIHGSGIDERRSEYLAELAHASGEFARQTDMGQKAVGQSDGVAVLGELLALLAVVSSAFRLRLEDLARENLIKVEGRWPGAQPTYRPLFDDAFPSHEQLPRAFRIRFIERGGINRGQVVQQLNGVFIGDRLTDNSNEPDDYRFHDVFHLAYVAHLGWSPVIRALLKLKRKSRSEVDENEDGARAMIIEEGIATWIFNHAKRRDFYADIQVGKLDYGLLKQVCSMVSGYEVDQCPLWQWEQAILEGFRMFRELRHPDNRGGDVIVDMNEHKISFEPVR